MTRVYQHHRIHQLENLFAENSGDSVLLKRLLSELGVRQTARAQSLRLRVLAALESLLVASLENSLEAPRPAPPTPKLAASTPGNPAADVPTLVDQAVDLLHQRGPLPFPRIVTEILRRPGRAEVEMSFRLALSLDPRTRCDKRDWWSTSESSLPPSRLSGVHPVAYLRTLNRPVTVQQLLDACSLSLPDLQQQVRSNPHLVLVFEAVAPIAILVDWGVRGYQQAAEMGWSALRGPLLNGTVVKFGRTEWDAILYVATQRGDESMLRPAQLYFGL